MELKIHARNVDVTPRLQEHVEKKVNKLDRYLPNIEELRVDLAIEPSSDHGAIAKDMYILGTNAIIAWFYT